MEDKNNCGGCYFQGNIVDREKRLIDCFLWQKAVSIDGYCDYWRKFTNENREIVQREAERLRNHIEGEKSEAKKEETEARRHKEQMDLTEKIHKKEIKMSVILFIGSLIGSLIVGIAVGVILGKIFG